MTTTSSAGSPDAGSRSPNAWEWPEAVWRAEAAKVTAGSGARSAWPEGNRVAVAISFDSDHETIALVGDGSRGRMSQGEFGSRVGSRRILALLDELRVPATFFMPAVSALLHPEEVAAYVSAGHELAMHGWIHESNKVVDYKTELALIEKASAAMEKLTGRAPVGMRTPSWDFSDSTLQVIRDVGLLYDSSLMADDAPYEILADGEPTGIVEVPVEWIRCDVPYFYTDVRSSIRPYTPPDAVARLWKKEFDGAYAEGGLFQLTMHPDIIGHRSRMAVLRELLEHIQTHEGVWFTTHESVARHVKG